MVISSIILQSTGQYYIHPSPETDSDVACPQAVRSRKAAPVRSAWDDDDDEDAQEEEPIDNATLWQRASVPSLSSITLPCMLNTLL